MEMEKDKMMTKIKIFDTIVDEMLETLDYKNYSKEEKEGARDCSNWIKEKLHKLYENENDSHFTKVDYDRLQHCLSHVEIPCNPKLPHYLASEEREGAKKFVLAIKSKIRCLKPES